jgi:hypothetical protein
MMSNSAQLVEHARELANAGFTVDERLDTLVLRGAFPSNDSQEAWIACAAAIPRPFALLQIYDPGIGGDLGEADDFDPSRKVSINIRKPTYDGCACFVFHDSAASFVRERQIPFRMAIEGLTPAQTFAARGLDVVRWDLSQPVSPATAPKSPIDATRFVRDFVPEREVVTDLSPWILITAPAATSVFFEAWQAVASRRLLAGLVSRAWLEGGHVWLQASGPPIFRVRADQPDLVQARSLLTEAAHWVFLSGIDIEARHVLFAGELARANHQGQNFVATIERALEAAKVAYEAHVQSSSRETLKVLADLRKTVIEETQKVAQRAQDLTATLWRDLAVSAAPFVLKIVSDAGKTPSAAISAAFYFAAAFFIAVSFVLQSKINRAFFDSQQTSRQHWMQTLYSYISQKEREEIAEAPIEKAIENYWTTHRVLAFIYVLLFFSLSLMGGYTLHQGSKASPSATISSKIPDSPGKSAKEP